MCGWVSGHDGAARVVLRDARYQEPPGVQPQGNRRVAKDAGRAGCLCSAVGDLRRRNNDAAPPGTYQRALADFGDVTFKDVKLNGNVVGSYEQPAPSRR